jgi:hypothetical protein
MSRHIPEAILASKAFGTGSTQPMLDFTYGGQQGWAPNLVEWVSNQAYVRRNLICVLLEAPQFFKLMPDPQKWVSSLKSLMELHCKSIEGFNAGLTVETDEHPVGGAGEMQQEVTDVKRARTEPSFTFVEKYGMPIQTFLHNWITYGLMDPDTKFAMVGTLSNQKPEDLLADWYSMSCLFMEPDPQHRKVVKSWVTTNMFPKETGEIIGKRDLTTASEVLNITVPFTGISQFSLGTNLFAQKILNTINMNNSNPYLRPSFIQDISADVNAAQDGYKKNVEDLGKSAVPGIR